MGSFPYLVAAKINERKLSLRKVAREIGLDPSFFSKVLSGKRSPPWDEKVLKKLAKLLGVDATQLIISTGKIPSDLQTTMESADFLRKIKAPGAPETEHYGPEAVRLERAQPKVQPVLKKIQKSNALSEDLL